MAALAGPAAASAKDCGDMFREGLSPEGIVASKTSCKRARAVAGTVAAPPAAPWRGCVVIRRSGLRLTDPCSPIGFRCRVTERVGARDYGLRVRCRQGARAVTFEVR
jgi:hypothetical protein